MHTNRFERIWEDLAEKHEQLLRGHRVKIRVLDGGSIHEKTGNDSRDSWSLFESTVSLISKGKRIPNGQIYSARDFYEALD